MAAAIAAGPRLKIAVVAFDCTLASVAAEHVARRKQALMPGCSLAVTGSHRHPSQVGWAEPVAIAMAVAAAPAVYNLPLSCFFKIKYTNKIIKGTKIS